MVIDINGFCIFIASDGYNSSSKLLDDIYKNSNDYEKRQIMILTNLEDDILFASKYPDFNYMICNKPDEDKTKLEDRFNCALNFIKVNNIKNYLLILDK